ncbi:thiamine-phosphate pyrophosphorylase [Deinobacterium chartae]|uniref:Thiamine-phosphate synthase n=1 Tax=Deinobacterium chartae TaxID=521158 RepID=A0A841I6Z4_9DEIO|nr:thiamine phosphate synthase [Deinobacterium chartae]MBB6099652.1 thiamine-phosphate pyrophosphorylase [Deinobacterium chartae]
MITLGRLYLVATPRPGQPQAEFLARLRAALEGGVDLLQLRCKDQEALPYLRLAARVGELAAQFGVPLIINDRPDVALAAQAAGVHLGQNDLPVRYARQLLPGGIIGRSSHAPIQAAHAALEGADYFAVGPVWATPTKPGRPAAGLEYVRWVARQPHTLPWFAIGGIRPDNLPEVLMAGATRVAVVRALLDAPDPARAAQRFWEVMHAHQRTAAPAP